MGRYPEIGEVFELEVDFDDPKNMPLGMVGDFGYNSKGWKHNGEVLTGKQKGQFRLVQKRGSWDEIGKDMNPTNGQWIQGFCQQFPERDSKGRSLGVHADSWVDPRGDARFPYVFGNGEPYFGWTGSHFDGSWLWLEQVK